MTIFRHRISGPGQAGDIWVNTMHSSSNATLAQAHAAWVALIGKFYATVMEPLWSTQVEATACETDQLDPATGKNVGQIQSDLTIKGTGTGLQLPQRMAVVVGLRTNLPTRAGRGRVFVPAPDSTHLQANGQLAGADANTIAVGMQGAIQTANAVTQFGIFHKKTLTISSIGQVTVGQVLGSQRRRTNKVPANYQSQNI